MCGIVGFIDRSNAYPVQRLASTIENMAGSLVHRGPDEGKIWIDSKSRVALGFRRLAIQDLSAAGSQPMVSSSGHTVLLFNGEIYNQKEMRSALGNRAPTWRGSSDTEALVECIDRLGIDPALKLTIGMFAIAAWDCRTQQLTLARDRLGKKPLYWTLQGGCFMFGSELEALRAHPKFDDTIDQDSLALYFRYGYFPAPYSVFAHVRQLEPGQILTLERRGEPTIRPYWSMADVVRRRNEEPLPTDPSAVVDQAELLLQDAASRRMISDVPLGAFLSGGVDSSLVVALMQKASQKPIRTFTIGFSEDEYNEARSAAAVARYLGTEHTELTVTANDALAVVPNLPFIYDEPFADASAIPTYLLSKLAKGHVTVALSGDGGDELFAGYNRYAQATRFRRWVAWLPDGMRATVRQLLSTLSPTQIDSLFRLAPRNLRPRHAGDKLAKLSSALSGSGDNFYFNLVSQWQDPKLIVPGAREPRMDVMGPGIETIAPDFVERMQYRDTLTYLPGDILTKVDRASMAVSLEARAPLLDHRVVEFAWSLPMRFKLHNGVTKWILRQVLYRHVPARLIERPKTGFDVPLGSWLRGPLREWAEDLLQESAMNESGLIDPRPVRHAWLEHLSGRKNCEHQLWTVLMFEAWRRRPRKGAAVSTGSFGGSQILALSGSGDGGLVGR